MQLRSGEILYGLDDRDNPANLQSMQFEKCAFINCIASYNIQNDRRSRFKDIHLKDCEIQNCDVGPAIFEDCTIENLRNTGQLFIMWGSVFRRVTLSGRIGAFKINDCVDIRRDPMIEAPFETFRTEFYRTTDWALDISKARFGGEFDVRGVPARLIRRDPETQVMITRERVAQPGVFERISDRNEWRYVIEHLIGSSSEDVVLAVPLAAAKAKREVLLQGLKELRSLDIVERD